MKAWQAWSPLLALAALAAATGLLAAANATLRDFLRIHLWDPIVQDTGYNVVNTAVLAVLAVASIVWLGLLFRLYDEPLDLRVAVAGLAFFAWGVTLRVFEDADLFAPFARAAGAPFSGNRSCTPDPQTIADCAGVLFVTPLLWIWLALAMWGLARFGLHVQWLGQQQGQAAAQRRARWGLGALAVGLCLPWLLRPGWLAATPHPVAPLLAALLCALALRRTPRLHWSMLLLSASIVLLAASASLLLIWFLGGPPSWPAATDQRPGFLLLAGASVAGAVLLRRDALQRLQQAPARETPGAPWLLLYLDWVIAGLVFTALAAAVLWQQGRLGAGSLGLLALLTLVPMAARRAPASWRDARLGVGSSGFGLLAFGGQVADLLVTAIGIDVLGGSEKHVLPRALMDALLALDLPEPLASYPAALALLLLKVPVVVLATWFIGVRSKAWWPEGEVVRALSLLSVGFIGAAPALRNLLRIAMGV